MDGAKTQTAFFRGRCLKGAQLPLQSGYTGYVVEKQPSSTGDDAAPERWAVTSTFDQLTYWNHDTVPTSVDPVRRAVDWAGLSEQVKPNPNLFLSLLSVALDWLFVASRRRAMCGASRFYFSPGAPGALLICSGRRWWQVHAEVTLDAVQAMKAKLAAAGTA